jgi:N-acetylmuramoyl-L-alanine amidase
MTAAALPVAARLAVAALLVSSCGGGGGGPPIEEPGGLPPDISSPYAAPGAANEAPAPDEIVPPPGAAPTVPPPQAESPGLGVLVTPHNVVVPVLAETDGGFRVRTPCGATRVVTDGTRVNATTVVLDAGHGGGEPGAISPQGLAEKGVNLAVVAKAKEALEAQGVSVVPTRTADYDLDLQGRADIVKALSPRAFVSIHHNADPEGPSPKPGTETYYQIASPDSKRLAGLLYEEIFRTLSTYAVPWVSDGNAGAKIRQGQHGDYYAMLRLPAPVPSALSEAAFISNPDEAALLSRPDVVDAEGQAVARAVVRYLTTDDAGSGFVGPVARPSPPTTTPPATSQPPCREPEL